MLHAIADEFGREDDDISGIIINYCPWCQQPYDTMVGPMCSCTEDAQDVLGEMGSDDELEDWD